MEYEKIELTKKSCFNLSTHNKGRGRLFVSTGTGNSHNSYDFILFVAKNNKHYLQIGNGQIELTEEQIKQMGATYYDLIYDYND
jgi:hypothetical protein